MINLQENEKKWQKIWEEKKIYEIDLHAAQNPFYNLMMFPYPSGEGLHMGNVFAYIGSDIYGRFQRFQGYDVFEPMGFDAFGIHSENYAIKMGVNPQQLIPKNIENFRENQLKKLGVMFDWNYQVDTTNPNYYKWTQWLFLELYKNGLAYKKKAPVNWCSSCLTVLANEQVENGTCERCKTLVEKRETAQWFFKITDYAQKLLDNLDWIDWSETTKIAQRRWIGRSEGLEMGFLVEGTDYQLDVYTTRPDTIFGATYMVIAPEHPLLEKIVTDQQRGVVAEYIKASVIKTNIDRESVEKEKTGVFTGAYAINPATEKPIPIWVSDYVLMSYGTGAIMAVPAHDQRDLDFANKYQLPIVEVIKGDNDFDFQTAYVENGNLINSGPFDGQNNLVAMPKMNEWLQEKANGQEKINYRLHDWCISRQRYWGPPIPIINCPVCGVVPVPEENLPVLLPDVEDFRPKGEGTSPLANIAEFVNVKCPKCGENAQRETDVMDNFLDSAWYFFRYPSANDHSQAFDKELIKKWLPVDMYIGGNEHAVLHLMYTRFITMVLKDLGHIDFEEPFKKFRAHGMIIKDGHKMSKSKGNVVNPDHHIKKYGVDALRFYLMFLGPYQEGGEYSDSGIRGAKKFLERVADYYGAMQPDKTPLAEINDQELVNLLHDTIKSVTIDVEALKYNTAIAKIRILFNYIESNQVNNKAVAEVFLKLIAIFAPHLAEELWSEIGNEFSIFNEKWPIYDENKIVVAEYEIVVQVNGKIRGKLNMPSDSEQEVVEKEAFQLENVKKHLENKEIVKIIFVKNKLMNIVVR